MTRNSTKGLVQPFKDPESVFRSTRKLTKTTSLDSSSFLEFEFAAEIVNQFEEEVTMTEPTMEEYMTTTRDGYGPGVVRPKIDDEVSFEIRGQFLKELRNNTFSGSGHEDPNEHIEKVLEFADLFHIPKITIDQVMLRAFPMSLTEVVNRWLRNEPPGSVTDWETLKKKFLGKYYPPARTAKKMEEINNFQQELDETLYTAWERFKELLLKCPQHYLTDMQEAIAFYKGFDAFTRLSLDSRGAIPFMKVADAKKAINEMVNYSQKWHDITSNKKKGTETSDGLTAIQAQLNSLGREIKKDCPDKDDGKTFEEALYTQFGGAYPQGQFRAASPRYYQRNNGNRSYQERRQSLEESVRKYKTESARRHEENSNLIKEIRAATDSAIRNQRASIKALEIQIGQISKVLQERGSRSLPSSTETNPMDHVKSISTIVGADYFPIRCINASQYGVSTHQNSRSIPQEKRTAVPFPSCLYDSCWSEEEESEELHNLHVYSYESSILKDDPLTVKCPKGIAENVLVGIDKFTFHVDFIVLDMPKDIKTPLILGRPFLSTSHAKIDVYKRKLTLRVGNDKVVFQSDKHIRNIFRRVYALSLKERMELDLEVRLMGEALIVNRLQDPDFEDFIELNDLNEPLEPRRNQVVDLGPTVEEGEVIDAPIKEITRTRKYDNEITNRVEDYLSFCDHDRKILVDGAYNLKFSCMIGYKHVEANFFPISNHQDSN
ncbi:putative ribonuclease H-like domain-containing protein [Tanacetum coccineum]